MLNLFFQRGRFKANIKPIFQMSDTECGVAALAMMFNYHKSSIPFELLREKCAASRDGCKATTLLSVAREFGFQADGFRVEIEDIATLGQPVIAFWKFNHYVVISGIDHKNVYLVDPALGKISVSLAEFDSGFTGVVLSLMPTANMKKQGVRKTSSLKRYFQAWITHFRVEWAFILCIATLAMFGPLLNTLLSSVFINFCLIGSNQNWLPWLQIFAILLTVFILMMTKIQQHYQFIISIKASLLKTSELLIHTLKLPLLYFSLRHKSEIITIIARAEMVLSSFFKNLTNTIISLCMAICCLLGMFIIASTLAWKILVIMTCFALGVSLLTTIKFAYEKKQLHSESLLYALTMVCWRNFSTIKACALEYDILAKWWVMFCKNLTNRNITSIFDAKIATLFQLGNSLTVLAMLYWGSVAVAAEDLTVGNLLAFYMLLLVFYQNSTIVLSAVKDLQQAYVAHLKITDLQDYSLDKRFGTVQQKLIFDKAQPIVQCNNLTFFYNAHGLPTLANIQLSINHGAQIALVGATGSGKSTLAKLLCGLYEFNQGTILFAGNDIAHFTAADYVQHITYVSQEITLFSGTVYENITLGLQGVAIEKIHHVLQLVELQELIAARGLYALVEENGNNFSGGERQRLELARALLQDAPIMIFDEATSALDVVTEAKIITNLRSLNKTIIYVAHRLSTITHCDDIYVLDQGSIVEHGSHTVLLQGEGLYSHLVQLEQAS